MVNTQMAKVYRLYGPRDLRLDLEKIVTLIKEDICVKRFTVQYQ